MENFNFVVVGAGIVGLATALQLQARQPHARIAIVEKESGVAVHQSGHNSGVIHAGVYYEPGSLKARLCRAGLVRTIEFCQRHEIPFRQCGKLIVATNDLEAGRLKELNLRATQNGVDTTMLNREQLAEREPNVSGVGALFVHATGIVDYAQVCQRMADLFLERAGEMFFDCKLTEIREEQEGVNLLTTQIELHAQRVIACAGLHSDRIARLAGIELDFSVIPFRGDFYRLEERKSAIVQHLIYPVADPRLPFLGIHLTATMDGGMLAGPSAMLAFHREGYEKFAFSGKDAAEMLRFQGLWRLLGRYPRAGIREVINSASRRVYAHALQKYCPSIGVEDLVEHLSGVRAQAVARNGTLIHDFVIKQTSRTVHVCNAPSPAATAALPIAESILSAIDI